MTEIPNHRVTLAGRDYPIEVAPGDHVLLCTLPGLVIVADDPRQMLQELQDRELHVALALIRLVERKLNAEVKRRVQDGHP